MKVCLFGAYKKEYSRNKVIFQGLTENNVKIVECYVPPTKFNCVFLRHLPFFLIATFFRYIKLIKKHFNLQYDVLFVPFPAFYDLPIARLLVSIRKKPLVFDLFISKYETLVTDRKCVKKNSLKAKLFNFYDKISATLPDKVLLDTHEHIKQFVNQCKIKESKFFQLPVGSPAQFRENKKRDDKFTVLFYGTFIPLHGIEYILLAADKLRSFRDIEFVIIGSGQTHERITQLYNKLKLENIRFFKKLPYKQLLNYIAAADICLGIFSDTAKSKVVVPNKVYDALALKKPLITAETPAIKEIGIKNRVHAILCKAADPKSLAESIILLKDDLDLRKKISENGYKLFKENFTPKIIGQKLEYFFAQEIKANQTLRYQRLIVL